MIPWLLDNLRRGGLECTIEAVHSVRLSSWLPAWTLPFLVLLLVGATALQYRRQRRAAWSRRVLLVALRSAAYAVALLIVTRPDVLVDAEGYVPGPVPIIVDGTQSMQIQDAGGRPRAERAARLAAALCAGGNEFPDLRVAPYWAGRSFRPFAPGTQQEADGDSTSIAGMLANGLGPHHGSTCPAVVLLSDGAHNTSDGMTRITERLRRERIPVHTVGFGQERSRDVALAFVLAEEVVFANEKARMYARLTHRGCEGGEATVVVTLDGTQVLTQTVVLTGETEMSVPLDYVPPTTGRFALKTSVLPVSDESTEDNNSYTKTVRVIDEKVKVLMVFGRPTWEYRYLRGAFGRDNRVEPQVVLESLDSRILRRTRGSEYVTDLPAHAEDLSEMADLVVLSAINALKLPAAFRKALAEFVSEHAGGLVVLSDRSSIPYTLRGTELEEALPVTIGTGMGDSYREELRASRGEPLTLSLTEEGLSSPLLAFSADQDENREMWQAFPPIYHCYRDGQLKPAAVSLLEAVSGPHRRSIPAVVQHSYGTGVVLFLGFDSTWRWRREYGDRYCREFWGKVVQFLGLPHLLGEAAKTSLHLSAEHCLVGERVTVTAKLTNPDFSPYVGTSVPLTMRREMQRSPGHSEGAEDGSGSPPTPPPVAPSVLAPVSSIDLVPVAERLGTYRARIWPEQEGTVTLELPDSFHARPVSLRVARQRREFVESGMNRPLLERLAKDSGGAFHLGAEVDADALLGQILKGRPTVRLDFREGLWDTWVSLLALLGLFSLEWLVRRLSYLD